MNAAFALGAVVAVVAVLLLVAGFVRAMWLDRLGRRRPVWPSKPSRTYLPPDLYAPTTCWPPSVPGPVRVADVTVSDLPRGEIGGAR